MRRGLLFLSLVLTLGSVGCTANVAANCEKAEECGELGDKTVEYCTSQDAAKREELRANPDCEKVLEGFDSFISCKADLGCDKREAAKADGCKEAWDEYLSAVESAGERCRSTKL